MSQAGFTLHDGQNRQLPAQPTPERRRRGEQAYRKALALSPLGQDRTPEPIVAVTVHVEPPHRHSDFLSAVIGGFVALILFTILLCLVGGRTPLVSPIAHYIQTTAVPAVLQLAERILPAPARSDPAEAP